MTGGAANGAYRNRKDDSGRGPVAHAVTTIRGVETQVDARVAVGEATDTFRVTEVEAVGGVSPQNRRSLAAADQAIRVGLARARRAATACF